VLGRDVSPADVHELVADAFRASFATTAEVAA